MSLTTEKTKTRKSAASQKEKSGRYHDDDKSNYAVTIGRPVEEVYSFYRDFKNLTYFMKDLKDIQILSPKKSHWVIELKNGLKAEWDAEITNERTNEMISWQSLEDSEVETSGTVWFRPATAGLGTVVSLTLDYKIPGGKVTEFFTKFVGEDPDTLAFVNLRRLKAFLEVGEIATIEGQTSGRGADKETTLKH